MTQHAPNPTLFTIGHSDHEITEFISLLKTHGIDTVADVRSQPYSRLYPQYNRELVAESLKREGIQYLFMGPELGARRTEKEGYRGKQARYDLINKLPAFREGLDRIRQSLLHKRIALMCAEKDPVTCHRMILVCRNLRSSDFNISHILENGELEKNEKAELRLLDAVKLPSYDLFSEPSDLIEQAYDLQGERIAYTEPEYSSDDEDMA